MLSKLDSFLAQNAFIAAPLLLAVMTVYMELAHGANVRYLTLGIALFFLGAVLLWLQRGRRRVKQLEGSVNDINRTLIDLRLQKNLQVERMFYEIWDLRKDRAAVLARLAALWPSGYRVEDHVPDQLDPALNDSNVIKVGTFLPTQRYLYIDVPATSEREAGQIRLAVSWDEVQMIGPLPEYTGECRTITEVDSQKLLREILTSGGYIQISEADNAAVTA